MKKYTDDLNQIKSRYNITNISYVGENELNYFHFLQ